LRGGRSSADRDTRPGAPADFDERFGIRRARALHQHDHNPRSQRRERTANRFPIFVLQYTEHERWLRLWKLSAQGVGQRTRASGIVRTIEHQRLGAALENLKTSR